MRRHDWSPKKGVVVRADWGSALRVIWEAEELRMLDSWRLRASHEMLFAISATKRVAVADDDG